MKINFRSGFTLIELLVVIGIIGILSAITLNGLGGTREKSRDGVRLGDLKSLDRAAELYFSEHNAEFPSTETWATDLGAYFANGAVPKDPKTKSDYSYKGMTSPKGYCFGAVMETEVMHNEESCLDAGSGANYQIKGP